MQATIETVPGDRMKAGHAHRVPLSERVIHVLDKARQLAESAGLVFSSATGRIPNQSGMPKLVRQIGIAAVPH